MDTAEVMAIGALAVAIEPLTREKLTAPGVAERATVVDP
jgi:hypothetical protein